MGSVHAGQTGIRRWRLASGRHLAQRLAAERKAVMALHQTVQHGIGNGRVADPLMPAAAVKEVVAWSEVS